MTRQLGPVRPVNRVIVVLGPVAELRFGVNSQGTSWEEITTRITLVDTSG